MPIAPRPEIEKIESCIHGSPDYEELARLGLAVDQIIDFSVNANPLGPPPELDEALRQVPVERYPDARAMALRRHLGERLGLNLENILAANGSVELMWLSALTFLERGDKALIVGPTFGEYDTACHLGGAEIIRYSARADALFELSVREIADLIRRRTPKLVFLCNPNNPTGQYLSKESVYELLSACADTLLVLDEAYVGFVDSPWVSSDLIGEGNLLILRSLTKDHSLAGLRLGFALAEPSIIATLQKIQPTWSVNAMAQAAGLVSLTNEGYLSRMREAVREAKRYLIGELGRMGLQCMASQTNFFMVEVGDGRSFRADLLRQGVLVRDCASFGLPEYVRLSARPLPECRRLVEAVKEVMGNRTSAQKGRP